MKTFYKVMACLGVALLLLGVVLSGVAMAEGGQVYLRHGLNLPDYLDFDQLKEWRQEEDGSVVSVPASSAQDGQTAAVPDAVSSATVASDGQTPGQYAVHKLDFELGAGEFALQPGEDFAVTTASGSLRGVDSRIDGDSWKIECTGSGLRGLGTVTITVPADFVADSAEIELGAGTLHMTGITANRLDLSVAAGRAELSGCTLANAELECGMGELVCEGVLTGRGSIDCGMGNVEVYLTNPDSFGWSVDCGVGSVTVMDQHYSGLGADAVQNQNADVFYAIDCGVGNVTMQRR